MKYFLYLFMLSISIKSFGQDKNQCLQYHDGTFYSYPKNSSSEYIDYRSGSTVREIEVGKTDTSYWSAKWNDPCMYEIKLQSGGTLKPEDKLFFKEHSIVYRITATSNDYYIFEGFIDKVNTISISNDTCWKSPSVNHLKKPLFTQLQNEAILRSCLKLVRIAI